MTGDHYDRTYGTLEAIRRSRRRSKDAEWAAVAIIVIFAATAITIGALFIRFLRFGMGMG